MARDIIPMEPIETECPCCKSPLFMDYQIAIYESGDSFQFRGLRQRATAEAISKQTYTPKPHLTKG